MSECDVSLRGSLEASIVPMIGFRCVGFVFIGLVLVAAMTDSIGDFEAVLCYP